MSRSSSNGDGRERRSGSGGNPVPLSAMPSSTKKILQSLKEIVNCPEQEIYSMLRECNMDPSETVNRLLNQDTFHEVKSKRDKKKEVKDSLESRSRGVNNMPNRGGRVGTDRTAGRVGSSNTILNEHGASHGKPQYKKENGSNMPARSSLSGSSGSGNGINGRPTSLSNSASVDTPRQAVSAGDDISLSSQPSIGLQHAWVGVPGQISMADIVKRGRPQARAAGTLAASAETPYTSYHAAAENALHVNAKQSASTVLQSESRRDPHVSNNNVSEVPENFHATGACISEHISHNNGWSSVDQLPAGNRSAIFETSLISAACTDTSTSLGLHEDGHNFSSTLNEVHAGEENINTASVVADTIKSFPTYDGKLQVDNLDDASFENPISYQSQGHPFDHTEGDNASVEISSIASNLQQFSIQNEDTGGKPMDGNPSVIFPEHLQVTNAECSHLSFGSFGSGISANFSGTILSMAPKSNLEVSSLAVDASSVDHSVARKPEYYNDEQLRSTSDDNAAPTASTSVVEYDQPSSSQPETTGPDTTDPPHVQYNFPSLPGYEFPSTTQPSAASNNYTDINSQVQNLAPLLNSVHAYTNSLPSSLLEPAAQPGREFDLSYLSSLATQPIATKYSTAMPSIGGTTITMPESAKPSIFSTSQHTPQSLTNSSIPIGSAGQHLPVHHYSQPTLPLGHFANMIGYPFLPQSYAVMQAAAFQQAYPGSNSYNQAQAQVHNAGIKYTPPQYKSDVSVSGLQQSGAVASGYGGFGSSPNVPSSFAVHPSTGSLNTAIAYDDTLRSQYKDGNHYTQLQQSENSTMWTHGAGSRTMSALPSSTYYSLQGQTQHSSYRQAQQPSHYGALGYPNFFLSQAGASEHQQNPGDGNTSGSQGVPSQSSHQIWQSTY